MTYFPFISFRGVGWNMSGLGWVAKKYWDRLISNEISDFGSSTTQHVQDSSGRKKEE